MYNVTAWLPNLSPSAKSANLPVKADIPQAPSVAGDTVDFSGPKESSEVGPSLVNRIGTISDVAAIGADVVDAAGPVIQRSGNLALMALGNAGACGLVGYGLWTALSRKGTENRLDSACSLSGGLETITNLSSSVTNLPSLTQFASGFGLVGGLVQTVGGAQQFATAKSNRDTGQMVEGAGKMLVGASWIAASAGVTTSIAFPALVVTQVAVHGYQQREAIREFLTPVPLEPSLTKLRNDPKTKELDIALTYNLMP